MFLKGIWRKIASFENSILFLKSFKNEGQSQILNMNILTCVAMINHEIDEVYSHLIF
jgi:hypothetical protein